MGISGFKFNTQLQGLTSWFLEIASLLGHNNFNSDTWTPNITSLTGSPTITGEYTRLSKQLFFTVVVNGTSQTSSSKIDNLPFTALDYGLIQIYNSTDRSLIGHDYIDKDTKDIYLTDWNVTSKNIIITGRCKISGV